MRCEGILREIVGLATLYGTTAAVKGTKHHRHPDPLQGFAHHLCHLLADWRVSSTV